MISMMGSHTYSSDPAALSVIPPCVPLPRCPPSADPPSMTTRGWFRRNPLHTAPRTSYDLRERVCIGSMTAMETAVYRKVPTDEAEAQMLASADLDDMKSKTHTYTLERTDRSQINPFSPPSCW